MRDFIKLMELKNPAHEGINSYAVTCAVSREAAIGPDELRKFSGELMMTVSSACFRSGAKDIGHIKAYAEHDTGFLYIDTLGTPEDVTVEGRDGKPTNRFRLTLNAVIYGLAGEAVRKATEAALDEQLSKFGFARESVAEQERER